jgi:hypothetical protein
MVMAGVQAGCLSPVVPTETADCRQPTLGTDGWQRTGGAALSMSLPPGFTPAQPPWQWERGQTALSLRRVSPLLRPGLPEERQLLDGCRATISGRTALIEIARIDRGGTHPEYFVLATWPNLRMCTGTEKVVFEARTFDQSEFSLLLAMIYSVTVLEQTGPQFCAP